MFYKGHLLRATLLTTKCLIELLQTYYLPRWTTLYVYKSNGVSCLLDDAGHVDAVDVRGARLGGEHGEDSGAAADVEDDLVLEEVLVVPHRVAVRQCPNLQSNER